MRQEKLLRVLGCMFESGPGHTLGGSMFATRCVARERAVRLVRGAYVINQMSGSISGISTPLCQTLANGTNYFAQYQFRKEAKIRLRYSY